MKEISMAVSRISGRSGRSCYFVLCCAVQAAIQAMPGPLNMTEICCQAGQLCGKRERAVCKALSRAAKDIWENGDRQELAVIMRHMPSEKPSPKDLVIALAQTLWCEVNA